MYNNLIENIKYSTKKFEYIFNSSKYRRLIIPFVFIFIYILFYFLIDFSSQSLVAHDEGLYARRARLISESNNWFESPFKSPHHKTIGSYWFIALSIRLFGYSELSLRLTSILSSLICLILCYLISSKVLNKDSALVSIFSLSSMPLWIQYSRYASPDISFVLCILLFIYLFLNFIECSSKNKKSIYIFFSGFFISISFFIRSYMAFVPFIGLTPFILLNLYKSRMYYKTIFCTGFFFGLIPTFLNLYFAFQSFGMEGLSILFVFAHKQATGGIDFDHLILIPVNFLFLTFPVGLLLIILFVFTRSKNITKFPLLVYVYPFISLFILLCMSTSYPHYFLFLSPSLAILFSSLVTSYSFRFSFSENFIKYSLISFLFFITCILISLAIMYNEYLKDYSYSKTIFIYSISLLLFISYINASRLLLSKKNTFHIQLSSFFNSIIIPQYISLSLLYNFGVLGNPNGNTKLFLNDPIISKIINSNKIYLYEVDSKIQTLLLYYIPLSEVVNSYQEINKNEYVLTSNISKLDSYINSNPFKIIADFEDKILLLKLDK